MDTTLLPDTLLPVAKIDLIVVKHEDPSQSHKRSAVHIFAASPCEPPQMLGRLARTPLRAWRCIATGGRDARLTLRALLHAPGPTACLCFLLCLGTDVLVLKSQPAAFHRTGSPGEVGRPLRRRFQGVDAHLCALREGMSIASPDDGLALPLDFLKVPHHSVDYPEQSSDEAL